jgi:hypothetical protein
VDAPAAEADILLIRMRNLSPDLRDTNYALVVARDLQAPRYTVRLRGLSVDGTSLEGYVDDL